MFCLPKFAADDFKARLKSGEINPQKLANMTSAERRTFFEGFLGEENAVRTNALFESKLLLKNQQQGIINWAKQVGGLKPEVQRDIFARVNRMTEVLQPKELDAFLEDLAAQKLGMSVTGKEASKIAELARQASLAKDAMQAGGDRMAYGRARVSFNNYVNGLKVDAEKLTLADFRSDPLLSTGRAISGFGGQTKSITASLDNSAIFNQGWRTLFTNPVIWARNARKTYMDMIKTLGGKNVMNEINADIVSRPTYDLMKKAKLSVGTIEEAFPTALPEKIPLLGRVYKASQDSYTGFVHRTRADVFDKMIKVAERKGVDLDKKQLESIGSLVNSLTGRGGFGRYEGPMVDAANNLFFSPRFFKSQIDVLTQPITGVNGSNFVRKEAAQNLARVIIGTATVLGTASVVARAFGHEDAVEWDPRSSDFGKIKIGNTRYGLGGGLPAVVTLASRIATKSTKSTTSGKIEELNTGNYAGRTVGDVVSGFAGNKAAPLFQLADDWWITGVDFDGEKPTVLGSALKLITPFGVSTYNDLAEDPEAEKILSLILAGHGISVSNY